jgi:hypothetical protein
MTIDKRRIEKIKTWNKHKQKKGKNSKTIKKGMKTNMKQGKGNTVK